MKYIISLMKDNTVIIPGDKVTLVNDEWLCGWNGDEMVGMFNTYDVKAIYISEKGKVNEKLQQQ